MSSDLDAPITLAEAVAVTGASVDTIENVTAEAPFNGPPTPRKVLGGTSALRLLPILQPEHAVAIAVAMAEGMRPGSNRLLVIEWQGSTPRGTWIGGLHEITVAGPVVLLPADRLAADFMAALAAHRAAIQRPN